MNGNYHGGARQCQWHRFRNWHLFVSKIEIETFWKWSLFTHFSFDENGTFNSNRVYNRYWLWNWNLSLRQPLLYSYVCTNICQLTCRITGRLTWTIRSTGTSNGTGTCCTNGTGTTRSTGTSRTTGTSTGTGTCSRMIGDNYITTINFCCF